MNVDVLDESGSQVDLDLADLTRLARFVLRRMRLHPGTELTIRLVDPDTIATLNTQWMGKEGPTDVLSFPMDELSPGRRDGEPEDEPEGYLGDIALCPQVAAQQAPAAGHPPADEVALLIVHGMLHLMGFDHATPDEHREMFAIQGRLLLDWQQVAAGNDPDSQSVRP